MFGSLPPYVETLVTNELAVLDGPTPKGRNNTLFTVAARLFSVAAAGALDMDDVEGELYERGRALGLTRDEVRATLKSAMKRGQQHPAALPASALRNSTAAQGGHEQPISAPEPCQPPSEAWQTPARAFVEWAQDTLWEAAHEVQLDYLQSRGLNALTVVNRQLGYNPRPIERSRAAWGLTPHEDYGDRLWLPRGIVLPWFVGPVLWKIQIRRDDTDDPQKRYYTVPGSANGLYGAAWLKPNRPAMLVEGVIDALAVQQEAGDVVAPLACGTTGARRAYWFSRLALASPVLLSFDNEGPGEAAAVYWQRILGGSARRWLPTIKDPAAMLERGLNVRAWVQAGLEHAL
jgi:hypothetical protein